MAVPQRSAAAMRCPHWLAMNFDSGLMIQRHRKINPDIKATNKSIVFIRVFQMAL